MWRHHTGTSPTSSGTITSTITGTSPTTSTFPKPG
jgi:hypothetical protein